MKTSFKHSSKRAAVACLAALLLGSVAFAAYTKPKPADPPPLARNGKDVGEFCVKTYANHKTLRQCRAYVTGGCLIISDKAHLKSCVQHAMQRVKQLRPNLK